MDDRSMALNFRQEAKQVILATILLAFWFTATVAAAPVVTVTPDTPVVSSCLAFGAAPGSGEQNDPQSGFIPTSPFMGFIYRDIPAFNLNPGDVLAFDLGAVNDFDVALDIEMVATTENGGTVEAGAFTKVVSNTYNPLKARGDTTVDNFDLRFIVDSAYSFPGGGLIIRFSNGSPAYREDNESCDQVGVVAMTTDTSGFFVQAFWGDTDGIFPWSPQPPISLSEEIIGGFQVIEGPTVLLASYTFDQLDLQISDASVGDTITYTIKVQNPGQSAATGITVTTILDDRVAFVSSSLGLFPSGSPEIIEWPITMLAAGAEMTLDVDLTVLFEASDQTISNSAELTASDAPYKTSLTDQSDILVEPAIEIAGEMLDQSDAGITTIVAGEPFIYRITATNLTQINGSGNEITVSLQEGLVFQQAESSPPTSPLYDAGPPESITWTIGDLNAGAQAILDIDVITSFAASGEVRSGTASITTPAHDEDVLTDIFVTRSIEGSNQWLDNAAATITEAKVGNTIHYEAILKNNSQTEATGLEVTVTVSEQLIFRQATPTPLVNVNYNEGTPGTITWEIGSIPAGETAALVVDMDVPFGASGQDATHRMELTGSDAPSLIGDGISSILTITDAAGDLLTGGSGNCFIATAAYGSYLEPEVMVLRQFRDNYLLTNEPGRVFVAWYYRNSPGFAAQIADHEAARTTVRLLLSPIIYALKYPLAALLLLLSMSFMLTRSRITARSAR